MDNVGAQEQWEDQRNEIIEGDVLYRFKNVAGQIDAIISFTVLAWFPTEGHGRTFKHIRS